MVVGRDEAGLNETQLLRGLREKKKGLLLHKVANIAKSKQMMRLDDAFIQE